MNRLDLSVNRNIDMAARALNTDRKGLARHLGLAEGALRAWEARGAPTYAQLALAAVVAGLNPKQVMSERATFDVAQDTDPDRRQNRAIKSTRL